MISIVLLFPFVLGVTWVSISYIRKLFNYKDHPLPPGPPSKPLIGNILALLRKEKWHLLSEYKHTYGKSVTYPPGYADRQYLGDLVYLHGLGNHVLVLNTMKAIEDLLGKRANIYSNRPSFTVVGELMGLDQSTPLLQYGRKWRTHRKFAHTVLSSTAVKQYHAVQEDLALRLCSGILEDPAKFNSLTRLYASRVVIGVTYGIPVETADNHYITNADETMDMVGKASVTGAYVADLLPILKYSPSWVPFQKDAVIGKEMLERLVTLPYMHVKKEMAAGKANPSLTRDLLILGEDNDADFDHSLKWAMGSLYGAGGESTYATVLIFILAMVLHPEKQALAQKEIDEIIGSDDLPTIADIDKFPYVNAVIKETMRWHPIVPLTLARSTVQEDFYRGYHIPRGCLVVPNVWAVALEDNGKYGADKFAPERFLDPTVTVTDPYSWGFGFGKRVCPGKALAQNSVFIAIATILSVFDILPPLSGTPIPEWGENLISYPKPFECRILPRSEVRRAVVATYGGHQARF